MSGFGCGTANMSFDSATVTEKQGIVSILGCDGDRAKAASIRRTLSADMSSKKWLAQNGFPPMKKVASSEHLVISSFSSSDGEDDKSRSQADVWTSILSQKSDEHKSNHPPPYIHPLVKRASSLSEKSLQVCTESLGSETGSDGFSPYSSSESVDEEKGDQDQILLIPPQQHVVSNYDKEETYNYTTTSKKLLQPRCFPPPLPSLSRADGPSLHMHCHRENGRLLLEAVSVPSNNFFHAQRQDGRLLLTLLNTDHHKAKVDRVEEKLGDYEDVFGVFDEDESEIEENEDEEEMGDIEIEIEKIERGNQGKEMVRGSRIMSSRVINVHRSAFSMKRFMGSENLNPSWSQKFNKGVKLVEFEDDQEMMVMEQQQQPTQFAQSLPTLAPRAPTPGGTGAASFNAYEYFWRAKSTAGLVKPLTPQNPAIKTNNKLTLANNYPKLREQQEMVLLRANKALVPSLRGCKEPRRTLLLWEPYCIATS